MRTLKLLFLGFLGLLTAGISVAADPQPSGEDRLREALRDTMLQLRTTQADLATLQAAQASLADDKKAADAKYDLLKKQVAAERAKDDKAAAGLAAQLSDKKGAVVRLTEDLQKSKAEGEAVAETAKAAQALGEKLKGENIVLQRRVSDLEAKNLALFLLGNQILSRYENFSLGNAISAKEPFVSRTRTKLENMVQDYEDQLLDQRSQD